MKKTFKDQVRKDHTDLGIAIMWSLALITGCVAGGKTAQAQQYTKAWNFVAQNRASIAALINQVEEQESTGTAGVGFAGYDNLVCGGDGESGATGNSTCIILNNATGNIEIGQDSTGDQTATSSTSEDIAIESDLEEALSSMN